MMTDAEITKLLEGIFTAKPEPIASELTAEFAEVIEAAKVAGLTFIPVIIIDKFNEFFTGRLDRSKYSETAILINTQLVITDTDRVERTIAQMQATLAHELGHCHHIEHLHGSYEEFGFGFCEDYADNFARALGYRK